MRAFRALWRAYRAAAAALIAELDQAPVELLVCDRWGISVRAHTTRGQYRRFCEVLAAYHGLVCCGAVEEGGLEPPQSGLRRRSPS